MHILVVDDEESQRSLLAGFLEKQGFAVTTAASGAEAIEKNRTCGFDLAILDLKMPEVDGIETMMRMKEIDPGTYFLILTGYGTVESAVQAMKIGAYDYLSKPINLDQLEILIERIQEEQVVHRELEVLKDAIGADFATDQFIAESQKMKEVLAIISRVARSTSSVLIQGESGTGKEVVARCVHSASDRRDNRFVAISCAALPETLLESELFGYERGAFTGADKRKIGKFELAHKGTLFLDEIGDLPLSTQVKLLRVVQEFQFERLGSNIPIKVDVRLITATNQDLRQKISEKKFREDLYYRLNVINISLPPLRDRRDDIRPLAERFLKEFAARCSKTIRGFSREVFDMLLRYRWPGNIRELENVIERAVVLCRGDVIEVHDLPLFEGVEKSAASCELLCDVEKEHIAAILDQVEWNMTEAAKRLGIHRNTLRMKIRDYDIKKRRP